jgi:hypothetical protein
VLAQPSSTALATLVAAAGGALAASASAASSHATGLAAVGGERAGLALAGLGAVLLTGLTTLGIWLDRRRRLRRATDGTRASGGPAPRPQAASLDGAVPNERDAVVLRAYERLVEQTARLGVVPEDGDTLRDYEAQIRAQLAVSDPELRDLFDAFEEAFYGDAEIDIRLRTRAIRTCLQVAEELGESSNVPARAERPAERGSRTEPAPRVAA